MRSSRVVEEHYQLTWDDLEFAHRRALNSGGTPGILNENGLESALARPYVGYYRSLEEKAAALIESIVCNHGFVDGNKRTAWFLFGILVLRSGYEFNGSDGEIVETLVELAKSEKKFDDLVAWFQGRLISTSHDHINRDEAE